MQIDFIVCVLIHILGQLLVQFAALLSCHYCNSVLAICLCLTLAKFNDDDKIPFKTRKPS